MLLWLQNNLPKSYKLWLRLLGFATSLHLVILFLIFFIHQGDNLEFKMNVNASSFNADAPVVFLPLYKTIAAKKNSGQKKGRDRNRAVKADKSTQLMQEKAVAKKVPKRSTVKEATTLAVPKKAAMKKPEKKAEPKKVAEKKSDSAKSMTEKEEVKKVEKPKEIEPEKMADREEKKPEAIKDVAEKLADKKNTIDEKVIDEKVVNESIGTNVDIPDDGNVRYVGRDDLDALQMQECISQELMCHWRPPVGIPKDRTCDVKVLVDWQGKTQKITIQKSSGVLIFDTSVRSAVLAMAFPKGLWGKEFSITFKQ